ncbi:Trk system potassium transport protein TrkA [Vulcanibacillus modesticaldus]|uniref:Trk system potassium uptake protein TrkA n=1 Tax=Vulcanibacillus modesticaldus TaxID=337097 RepID=A0A1D2YSN3_9BACI|nr:Trk system potassium transporter TrkA [Vulcanibacillus modesticaldus]OEF97739.1 Trk system potassium transport protein TrkA [Vulcanibacillus modesticaldus]
MKVMIIGAGKLGYKVAESLLNSHIDVTVVDSSAKVINSINDHLDVLAVNANGLEVGVLKELGIEKYDLLIASTSSDETNTIICTLAKKLGCKKTIARIRNPEYMTQLDFIKNEMGIDHIVSPDLAIASEISRYLLKRYSFYFGDFAKGKVQMHDFHVNNLKNFIDKRVMDLPGMEELLIVAIMRDGNIIIPDGTTIIKENDIIYIMGKSDNIQKMIEVYELTSEKKYIKNVMIFGGGKVGYYLAKQLLQAKINVTIIERDRNRCIYLSEKLNGALVIHGDGTDINLLEEENLSSMDAFIAVTDFDEQNLLMTLMAKQSGINKVIAKISRPNYEQIIEKLGIDVAFNPIYITASDILKFIRGGKVVSVSLLLGGQAEVTEVIVEEGLKIIGKKISELNLPKGVIVGAIVHKGKVIIPKGSTVIDARDRLIIFSLTSNIDALDIFLKPSRGVRINELFHRNKSNRNTTNY